MSETLAKDKVPSRTELNNNESHLNMDLDMSSQRVDESASLSSASSNNSDLSDDAGDEPKKDGETLAKKPSNRKLRSLSDSHTIPLLTSADITDAFPSLPDSVLEKLGLSGNGERERLNEDELEQKFVALSLAFTIDAATIKDRCERQKRYRDQTEVNLSNEITKVIDQITQIHPSNTEKAEHLTDLLAQIDVIVRASTLASISAERFGAVQHEARLSDAVNLMINYVTLLKQQRDSARKQLQYTKKVLQDTNTTETSNVKRHSFGPNGRSLTQRRASIATLAQDVGKPPVSPPGTDSKKLSRRTSDISARVSAFARSTRPSRLELGVDLNKIKEGIVDDNAELDPLEASDGEEEVFDPKTPEKEVKSRKSSTPFVNHMTLQVKRLQRYIRDRSRVYAEYGVFHDCFYITACVCFMIGFFLLAIFLIHAQITGGDSSTLRSQKDTRIKQ
ncbi:hypothetical protein PPYR_12809 [Photinus pyralis]|uniref:Lymphoid-restricted membrane protein n=2 Tax=Photinus pyralis TaxID=7054 RepID=A0A1Y1LE71_PHOPY|nr:uncharacterized protein LOC116179222 [Photinus pyralis]KAB0793189.1 hypothetical protein PPYR_12809 [Photinus pyralis]